MNVEEQRAKRIAFLRTFLFDVEYTLSHPTIVTITFRQDLDNQKLWQMDTIMREFYGACSTGPISTYRRPGFMSYHFRNLDDLALAREELGLPDQLQPGPCIVL